MTPSEQINNDSISILKSSSTNIPKSPDQAEIQTFNNPYTDRDYWIEFVCPEYTSLCPVTGQPDFGEIQIRYIPNKKCIESKSLKLYLFAFRNQGIFYEHATNKILDDLVRSCSPKKMNITGRFTPRGGISITVSVGYP
jgi:7-cyano-7-deazaguanine reductase